MKKQVVLRKRKPLVPFRRAQPEKKQTDPAELRRLAETIGIGNVDELSDRTLRIALGF